MEFQSVSLRTKLIAAFGGLAVLVLAVSFLAVHALNESNLALVSFVGGVNARGQLAGQIQMAVQARAIAARNLVLVSNPADIEAEQGAVFKAHEQVQKNLNRLKEMVAPSDVPENVKALVADIDKVEQAYGPVALDIVRLAVDHKRADAIAKMNDECRPLLAALIGKVNQYALVTAEKSRSLVDETGQAYLLQRRLLMAACIVAVVAALLAGFSIVRSLTRALGAEPNALGEIARRVAEGDLSPAQGAEVAVGGSVFASLVCMQQSLVKIVGQVRGSSDSIATGAAQIASGNADLSQRTEEQASALQQTAATMEEFGNTVRQNADSAKMASQMAINASGVAAKGGEVVAKVVDTMKGINDSSKKIGDIIGVIDGIAFQTNILALNAAVEAARAGEQGRGFAVVATEVRSLAGRSAEAAKEIKSLINASVEQVERGTLLVDQAGQTMSEVVTSIQRVSDIVGEISSASSEQSAGVAQISQAVGQMDQTTQQNAALVEQSAAAAQSLEHQAQQLVSAVSVFKMDGMLESASLSHRAPLASAQGRLKAKFEAASVMDLPQKYAPVLAQSRAPHPSHAPAFNADGAETWERF
jgi:methyl-accepting chemotaxis protein-1 (serine sensor receptor)